MQPADKFYYPQLDGLRFFAFFLVYFHHFAPISIYLKPDGFAAYACQILKGFGWIGVDIFLCLSSFLLTSLLIKEHRKTGHVSIKRFLIRRALRIWPLYYLIIFLAFVIFPKISLYTPPFHTPGYTDYLKQHFLPFSLFMGNLSYAYFTNSLTVIIAPLWTISLEEQFYLFWPIVLFIILPKNIKWFFIATSARIILSFLVRIYIIKNEVPYPAIWVFSLGRLDAFALGALVAFLYTEFNLKAFPFIALLASLFLFKTVVTSTGIGAPNTIWQLFVVDLAGALLIYVALYSKKVRFLLSIKPLPWLGKITFGLYVFHDVMIHITSGFIIPFFKKFITFPTSDLANWWISFILVLLATIACAAISYYCYERPFLKLKDRFAVIKSRPV